MFRDPQAAQRKRGVIAVKCSPAPYAAMSSTSGMRARCQQSLQVHRIADTWVARWASVGRSGALSFCATHALLESDGRGRAQFKASEKVAYIRPAVARRAQRIESGLDCGAKKASAFRLGAIGFECVKQRDARCHRG